MDLNKLEQKLEPIAKKQIDLLDQSGSRKHIKDLAHESTFDSAKIQLDKIFHLTQQESENNLKKTKQTVLHSMSIQDIWQQRTGMPYDSVKHFIDNINRQYLTASSGNPNSMNLKNQKPCGWVYSDSKISLNYEAACRIITEAAASLHPQLLELYADVLYNNWIDHEIREGKRPGAWALWPGKEKPAASMNYDGSVSSFMTLLHEASHLVHYFLMLKNHKTKSEPHSLFAETGAVLLEFLVMSKAAFEIGMNFENEFLQQQKFQRIKRQLLLLNTETGFYENNNDKPLEDIWQDGIQSFFGIKDRAQWQYFWQINRHFFSYPFYSMTYIISTSVILPIFENTAKPDNNTVRQMLALLASGGEMPYSEFLDQLPFKTIF